MLPTLTAVRVAQWQPAYVAHLRPLPDAHWLAVCNRPTELRVLDAQLQTLWRAPLPSSWTAGHAVADDRSLAALALRDEVRLVDRGGGQLASFPNPAAPWHDDHTGSCALTADGRHLWAVVSTTDGRWLRDELWLIDLASRSLLDRHRMAHGSDWTRLHRHPDGRTVAIASGYAQDCNPVTWARPELDRLTVWQPEGHERDGNVHVAAVHPARPEYLTVAIGPSHGGPSHGGAGSVLARHQAPSGATHDRLAASAILPEGTCGWFQKVGYLTDELLLADFADLAWEGVALLRREPLQLLAWVIYPDGDPRWSYPPSQGTWVTGRSPTGQIERWTLPEVPRLAPVGAQLRLFG
jgi:hypothetical protein